MESSSLIPILVSFLGAGLGAYFAVVKSKKEKLWQERYETLKEVVSAANAIVNSFTVLHLEEMVISVASGSEREAMNSELAEAKSSLRGSLAKSQLLFYRHEVERMLEAYVGVNSAFQDLRNADEGESYSCLAKEVSDRAETLMKEAINLAQEKCL